MNADSLNQLLGDLKRKSGNIRPALVGIAGIMMDSTEENFENEGRPRWPDLSESTKKARAKKGKYTGKILQVKGQLAASISPRLRCSPPNMAVCALNSASRETSVMRRIIVGASSPAPAPDAAARACCRELTSCPSRRLAMASR